MAQLYWRYSTMNAGKSIDVLKTYHNYKEQGKKALLFTSAIDNRFGTGYVASRIGIKEKAMLINEETNIFDIVKNNPCDCVLIDEGQFLKKHHVEQLSDIKDLLDIPVIVYGLRTDFTNQLFEGSAALFTLADKIEELKTICWFCNKKATANMRVVNGRPTFEGEQIVIGDNANKEENVIGYFPVCSKCYKEAKRTGKMKELKS